MYECLVLPQYDGVMQMFECCLAVMELCKCTSLPHNEGIMPMYEFVS